MALIELGLTEDQFYCTPPRYTFLMQLQNKRKLERQWEQTRYVAAMVHNMAFGQKRQIPPKRLVPLSLDKRITHPEITKEEAEYWMKKWKIKQN